MKPIYQLYGVFRCMTGERRGETFSAPIIFNDNGSIREFGGTPEFWAPYERQRCDYVGCCAWPLGRHEGHHAPGELIAVDKNS